MGAMVVDTVRVDTARVTDRRSLRFDNFEQAWADVEKIAAAERDGTLRRTGNWETGQVLGHLAAWASYPFEGYPQSLRPPWWVKAVIRLGRGRFLKGAMRPGIRIPRIPAGTEGTERISLDEGLDRLHRAWSRLDTQCPPDPNPLFGPLTHEQWKRLNLGHAELHLSFLHPS
jgi:hypothetical protein